MSSTYMTEYDYLIKTVVVGDSGVGKSSLLKAFNGHKWDPSYVATLGVDFMIHKIDLDGKIAKMQMWDTAGQDRFRAITAAYYRGAHCVLVVVDVTDPLSLKHVPSWVDEARTYAPEDVQLLMVLNKVDQQDKRRVTLAAAQEVAAKNGMQVVETSAKTSYRVTEAFSTVARSYISAHASHLSTIRKCKLPSVDVENVEETKRCCIIL